MRMVKLPDYQWVRADHVVLIQPERVQVTAKDGEVTKTSKLRVCIETPSCMEFFFDFQDPEKAFNVADELAAEVMKRENPLGGIQYT